MKLIAPIVHRNGTSKDDLLEQYMEAFSSLGTTIDLLVKIETHDRDYYVHPIERAGTIARARRSVWLRQLGNMCQELSSIAIAIQANQNVTDDIHQPVVDASQSTVE